MKTVDNILKLYEMNKNVAFRHVTKLMSTLETRKTFNGDIWRQSTSAVDHKYSPEVTEYIDELMQIFNVQKYDDFHFEPREHFPLGPLSDGSLEWTSAPIRVVLIHHLHKTYKDWFKFGLPGEPLVEPFIDLAYMEYRRRLQEFIDYAVENPHDYKLLFHSKESENRLKATIKLAIKERIVTKDRGNEILMIIKLSSS